jgi:hypothetical protein
MLTVCVLAHAALLSPGPGEERRHTLQRVVRLPADKATVAEALAKAGISRGFVGVMSIGGTLVDDSYCLEDGAELDVYPFFGGG